MDVVKPDPGLEQTNPDPSVYRCRRCRRIVASRSNLMTHTIKSKNSDLNQSSNRTPQSITTENLDNLPNIMKSCTLSSDKSLDRSSELEVCDKIYFVEPLDWMNVAKDVQGCLKCPKCSSKLGNFHWTEGEWSANSI
jgi:dual specificity phosphatase 12